MSETSKAEEQFGGAAVPRVHEVTAADLPLHCPMEGTSLWNSHPRVYLPIQESGGRVLCPYCGTEYVLKPSTGE